jgi:enediyne biosynthesis protein E4
MMSATALLRRVVQNFRVSCGPFVALLVGAAPSFASDPLIAEKAFVPAAAAPGQPRFTSLPPAQTGVDVPNNFTDPEMWGKRYQELTYGAIGTGVAAGDFDNDGLPDLFIASKTERSKLLRNLGGWKFEDVTERAGLLGPTGALNRGRAWVSGWLGKKPVDFDAVDAWRQGACFADVNNDGWLDLYICRFAAPNLLFINQRDGTFKEEAEARGVGVVDGSGMAAFCDYDRDGWLDLYLLTNMLDAASAPKGQRDYLFRNNRDGTFTDVTERAGIQGEAAGHSATWWDYDEDGWPDLYVANDFAAPDRLYRNNRDGTFTDVIDSAVPRTPYYAMGSDLADVDGDGRIDFYVGDMAATTREKDQRGMASSRARAQLYPEQPHIAPQYMRNALYLNTGTGRCLEIAQLAGLAATDWTWSVRFEDLDNDGRVDLHVTNGMNREYHNADLLARSMAAENPEEARRVVRESPIMAEANLAYRNVGEARFEAVGSEWGLDENGVSFGSAFADFDGDGDLDIVYSNYQKPPTLLRNNTTDGVAVRVALRGRESNRFGVGATIRLRTKRGVQVRTIATARGYLSSSEPIAHFGLGPESEAEELSIEWPSGHRQSFRQMRGGRLYTITEPEGIAAKPDKRATEPRWRELAAEVGLAISHTDPVTKLVSEQPFMPFRLDRLGPALVVADLNGDGVLDVVVGGSSATPGEIRLGRQDGTFSTSPIKLPAPPAGADDGPIVAFDADGDRDLDLLVTRSGDAPVRPASSQAGNLLYQPLMLLNSGRGEFTAAPASTLPELNFPAGAAAVADFDEDGATDVFIGGRLDPGRYPMSPRSALLLNRGGRFEDVSERFSPALVRCGLVTAALFVDLDRDGWRDLVVAREWDTVACFRNVGGRSLEDVSEAWGTAAAGSGLWTALAAADLNGDARLDLVAGNLGLNTPIQANSAAPYHLYYGEFAAAGTSYLIEAATEGGRIVPVRTRTELAAKVPAVARRFPQNDAFAAATLEEILGADRVRKAKHWAVTELRSGVFLSQPNAAYRFAPLPWKAQVAPLQGIVCADINGDGSTDLVATQNSHAPIAALGRFDAGVGVVLVGDGKGSFSALSERQTGFVLPGNAKAAVTIDADRDGTPEVLTSVNGGRVHYVRPNVPLAR